MKNIFTITLEPVDVRAVIDANNIKWKPTDAQCIDILEEAYRISCKTNEVGLSESTILWAIEEHLDFDDFCKEELNTDSDIYRYGCKNWEEELAESKAQNVWGYGDV